MPATKIDKAMFGPRSAPKISHEREFELLAVTETLDDSHILSV